MAKKGKTVNIGGAFEADALRIFQQLPGIAVAAERGRRRLELTHGAGGRN
jgi:hypothetical protein